MAHRFVSFGSSSVYGNAYLLDAGPGARLLVDCGVGLRRLEEALAGLGIDPHRIDAVILTHAHSDHVRAVTLRYPFPQRYRVPVYAAAGLWDCLGERVGPIQPGLRRILAPGGEGDIGGVRVRALPKPHDCVDAVGLVIEGAWGRWLFLTDLGHVPPELVREGAGCEYLVVEANHDPALEAASGRPYSLIRRVLGSHGHLSNDQAGAALAGMAGPRTRAVFLAHLSLDCNRPGLAYRVCREHLARAGYRGDLEVLPPGGNPYRWTG